MKTETERLTALEEEAAHLRLANEELSNEVLTQWKKLEQLEKTIAQLESRFEAIGESLEEQSGNQKPPHW